MKLKTANAKQPKSNLFSMEGNLKATDRTVYHSRSNAVHQTVALFDHLVGAQQD
jgi:hypothetical protein